MAEKYHISKEQLTQFFSEYVGRRCFVYNNGLVSESYMEGEVYLSLNDSLGTLEFHSKRGISDQNEFIADLCEKFKAAEMFEFASDFYDFIKEHEITQYLENKTQQVAKMYYTSIRKVEISEFEIVLNETIKIRLLK